MNNGQSTTINRLKPVIKLDFYRLFHTPLFYIMVVIAGIIPALVLSMTGGADATTGEVSSNLITNVWDLIARSGAGSTSDFGSFATIDMVFIFAGILMAIFVAHDYSSGFVKNIFTVHSKKQDYALSKTAIGVFSGICMIVMYVLSTIAVGLATDKSFDVDAMGLVMCILAKMVMMIVFCSLFLSVAILFKDRLWLTLIGTFVGGMVLYPVAGFAGLDASIVTLVVSLLGSVAIGYGLNLVSQLLLKRRDLI